MKRGDLALSADEAASLQAVLGPLSARAKRPLTLGGLLSKWRDFVGAVERGYSDSIYDYTNELGVRTILDEIIHATPAGVGRKITEAVAPEDERFRAITRTVDRPLLGRGGETRDECWWLYRIPANPGPGLKQDLVAERVGVRVIEGGGGKPSGRDGGGTGQA
jgi:hypothetical protein